jgi:hypothetical protein
MNMKNCGTDELYVTAIFIQGVIVVPNLAAITYLNIAILTFRAIFNCNTESGSNNTPIFIACNNWDQVLTALGV